MSKNHTVCPSCNSTKSEVYLKGCKDILYGFSGEWDLIKCLECDLVYTIPPLNETNVNDFYPKNYLPYKTSQSVQNHPIGKIFRRIAVSPYTLRYGEIEWNELPFGNGQLLEIGCGAGGFLNRATTLGWECCGIDISPFAVEAATKNAPKAKIFQGSLDEINFNKKFDVIKMAHVLEHLPNPMETLKACFELLEPGGKLIIEIPNLSSLEAKFFGRHWTGLDIPRHIIHFNKSVIKNLLNDIGFSVLRIKPIFFASSIFESLITYFPNDIRSYMLGSPIGRFIYFLIVFPACLSYLMGNWGVIEVIAQKPYASKESL